MGKFIEKKSSEAATAEKTAQLSDETQISVVILSKAKKG
jgi:hypothetical protein